MNTYQQLQGRSFTTQRPIPPISSLSLVNLTTHFYTQRSFWKNICTAHRPRLQASRLPRETEGIATRSLLHSQSESGQELTHHGESTIRRSIGTRMHVRGNSSRIDWKHHRTDLRSKILTTKVVVNKQKLPTLDCRARRCRFETRTFTAEWHATRNRVYVYDRRSCRYWHVIRSTSHSILNRRKSRLNGRENCA